MTEFWRFAAPTPGLGAELHTHHDPFLVALSGIVAFIASFAALATVDLVRTDGIGSRRTKWLITGATAMGGGIWAMHFIAMLAFSMPTGVTYALWITLASMVPSALGSGAALVVLTRTHVGAWHLQVGGLLMAVGIGAMHYTGMEAIRGQVIMRYDPALFAASILIAHLFATSALHVRSIRGGSSKPLLVRVAGAVVLGGAVTAMHHGAMAAVRFYPDPSQPVAGTSLPPLGMSIVITLMVILIAGLAAAEQARLRAADLADKLAGEAAIDAVLAQARKLESIGRLAAGIAHEINTPTQYVKDNTLFFEESFEDLSGLVRRLQELVRAARAGAVPDELLAAAESAIAKADVEFLLVETPLAIQQSLQGVDRVAQIVQAMREFSHPSTEKAPTDLNAAIRSTVTVASSEWKYVADLATEMDEALPPVPCVLGEFNQVILNLIVNAAHAIGDCEHIDVARKGTITIRTRAVGDGAEIEVEDTGTGMTDEVKARMFDPFFTTKPLGKGTGQGLMLVHAVIVKKLGGQIRVRSEPGRGTLITMRLPLLDFESEGVAA